MLLSCLAYLPCSWQRPPTCTQSKTTLSPDNLHLSTCSNIGIECEGGKAARWGAYVPLLLLFLVFVTLQGFVLPKRSLLLGLLLGYGPLPSTREMTYMGHKHALQHLMAYLEMQYVQEVRHLKQGDVIKRLLPATS